MHVEAVTSGDRLVADGPGPAVSLTETQRTFSVEYTGIRLSDPQAVEFRYRLEGLQDEWVHAGERRAAFFTEVPPGTYTFEVAGRTRNGPWSAEPARLTVTVAPFFYETWWFYGLCAMLLGLGAVGGVRYRFYALRRRKEELNRKVQTRTQELAAAKEEAEQAKETTEEALETVEEQAEQLRRLDDMKSRFFANVSHELRTPLSLMIGPVQQLLDRDERPDSETEMLEIVHRNAERLQHLVEQLLDLARYDAGHLDLAPQRHEWAAFVEQVTQRFAPMAEAEGVTLSTNVGDAERAAVFDPNRMETVLSNLLRNALTYTPAGGAVEVRAAVDDEEATLAVADTGPGIPPGEQEALFDRFTRGVGPSQRGGTGIGLALTKALVTLHDGTVSVDSTPEDGSTFTVRWPREGLERVGEDADPPSDWTPREPVYRGDGQDPAGTASVADDSEAPGDAAPPDRTTVLVVDDNADVRRYVRRLLEPRYRVLEATDGQDGLERTRSALPDLVVADVMMPELNGFEMVRDLRQSARTDCIPVVMLTARAEEADQVEGLAGGAEAYVTKPFDADVLTAQVDRLIATRRRLRKRFEGGEQAPDAETGGGNGPPSFEERVRTVVAHHLADPSFSVEELAEEVGLARRTVTRKVKKQFERTPSQLIRAMRVEKGAELLVEEAGTISEVAYAVGFNSLSYFSRCFKGHFGVSPSTYRAAETEPED
jgi:signal transduction histidine kinase/DNA-binding response OmpR family regulator